MASDADRFGYRDSQGRRPDLYDEQRSLRDDFDAMPGVLAAQRRLVANYGHIYPAFKSLECGIDVDAMLDYIEAPLKGCGLPKHNYGLVVGVLLGAIIVAVEADREARMTP